MVHCLVVKSYIERDVLIVSSRIIKYYTLTYIKDALTVLSKKVHKT